MEDVVIEKGAVIKITCQIFEEVGKYGVPAWVLSQLESLFRI
jgi:hypothetical protein